MNDSRDLILKYAGGVVKHLGLQMYAGPVPAIAELIANAWDADAANVSVSLPVGSIDPSSIVSVRDDGVGMAWEDLDTKYMIVGRDARKTDGDRTDKLRRKRMAHKGLGKLAGFGIADVVEVVSVKNGKRTRFVMDYTAIKKLELGENYPAEVMEDSEPTSETDGTLVTLKTLKIKNAIPLDNFFSSMGRRFSILSDRFQVRINGKLLAKEQTPFQIRFPSNRYKVSGEKIIKKKGELNISGAGSVKYWIGFTEKPIKRSEMRGITVLSRGRLVQEPWFFDISGGTRGQHGMQYITGEVEADFLDDETDHITTGRNTVMWDMSAPAALKEWGVEKVKFVLENWVKERGKKKLETLKRASPYMERIKKFPKRQRKELESVVRNMASIETIEDDRLTELVRSLIHAYENTALAGMIDEISALSVDAQAQLYKILQEFQVLESVSLAQLVRSRMRIIEQLEKMIDAGVREKPDMQDYLKEYPWLIDPTYTGLSHESRLDTILKKKFGIRTNAVGKNRRVDFFCLGDSGTAHVVEVKRPQATVTLKDVQQLVGYVDFLRMENEKETAIEGRRRFYGWLVGSTFAEDTEGERNRAFKDGIYTKTWDNLLRTAGQSHKEFFDAMRKKVPGDDPRLENFD